MNTKNIEKKRDSSLELFRIMSMLVIVAHHYVANSGLIWTLAPENVLSGRGLFTVIYGWGGKTGINCFILITGYFMCKSNITLKKFLKVIFQIVFYNVIFYIIFALVGYTEFSIGGLCRNVLPIYGIGTSFISSYIVLYLCIPFLNTMLQNISEKMHMLLLILLLSIYTVLPSFFKIDVSSNYVIWFTIIYLCAAYIRLYPKKIFDSRLLWGILTVLCLLLSWISVVADAYSYAVTKEPLWYFWVYDSNKALAFLTALCAFLFFKNLHLKYNPVINKIAAATFGVLLIHANNDSMRQWLWVDTLKNKQMLWNKYYLIHAVGSVIVVYIACTLIDLIRIQLIEKPFFKLYDRVCKIKE